jgi:hypothetical protein
VHVAVGDHRNRHGLHDLRNHLAIARHAVAVAGGAAVHGDGRGAVVGGGPRHRGPGARVHGRTEADLRGHGHRAGTAARRGDEPSDGRGIAEQGRPGGVRAHDALLRAAEVEVDDGDAEIDQPTRRFLERRLLAIPELHAQRPRLVVHPVEPVGRNISLHPPARRHHLGVDQPAAAEVAYDVAKDPIREPGDRRREHWMSERDGTDAESHGGAGENHKRAARATR